MVVSAIPASVIFMVPNLLHCPIHFSGTATLEQNKTEKTQTSNVYVSY